VKGRGLCRGGGGGLEAEAEAEGGFRGLLIGCIFFF